MLMLREQYTIDIPPSILTNKLFGAFRNYVCLYN